MKLDKLVGTRFKERPSDCVIDSHALMVRGGYMKYVGNGIYTSMPLLKRVTKKIEKILREEMDAIDGQEVSFPVVLPANIWEESGRYESVGSELLRFSDRNDSKHVLGMTHEEAAVQAVRDYATTYSRYPFMIYQLQTKFRDEARPRAGMIRVREFVMKDAYSFHVSQEDLEQYYKRVHRAYVKIFERCGIPDVVSVASDSGMMGGSVSHEFMLLTPAGEDSIIHCPSCEFYSNMEAARCIVVNIQEAPRDLTKVYTPNCGTIAEVCDFLGTEHSKSVKAVVYQQNPDDAYVVVFLRGDLDVNETKLTNFLGCDVHTADITPECGIVAGFIGPIGLPEGVKILLDNSLADLCNASCGANEKDYHLTGLNPVRDLPGAQYSDFAKVPAGGICPECGQAGIRVVRGIEVGNIFQLGTKYSKTMGLEFVDENDEYHYAVMGSYGIGVGRLAASIIEARHDAYGPIWPASVAPFDVHICCLRADDAQAKTNADRIYEGLSSLGIECIYDDRKVAAGIMFADADLIGVPLRIIVSPRNNKDGVAEISARDKSFSEKVPLGDVVGFVKKMF